MRVCLQVEFQLRVGDSGTMAVELQAVSLIGPRTTHVTQSLY